MVFMPDLRTGAYVGISGNIIPLSRLAAYGLG